MKYLFIVQGEGRGHLTQAISLQELLVRNGHQVVEVLVGQSKARTLPAFFEQAIQAPIKRFISPNFLPVANNKRVSLGRSIAYNITKLPEFFRSMRYIHRCIEQSGADKVINFYELLTGLTYLCFAPQVPQIAIGHQYLFLHKDFQFPRKHKMSLASLRFFTRLTCVGACKRLALSFREMSDDWEQGIQVVPPLLRKEVLKQTTTKGHYIHGYVLNAGLAHSVLAWHKQHPDQELHFFWDKKGVKKEVCVDRTLTFHPIDDRTFIHYMAGAKAYATTAGFESVCEAMYLDKPIMMIPAHIEQDCNAFDAAACGAGIYSSEFEMDKLMEFADSYQPDPLFKYWVRSGERILLEHLEEDMMLRKRQGVPTVDTSTCVPYVPVL